MFNGRTGYFLYCNRRVLPGREGLLKGIIERRAVADGFINDGCRTHSAIQTKGDCQNFRLDGRPGRCGRISDQDLFWIFTFQDGLAIPGRDDESSRQFTIGDQLLQVVH